MMTSGTQKVSSRLRRLGLIAVACIIVVMLLVALAPPSVKNQATTFDECVAQGGTLMESDPEQCAINGKTFTNTPRAQDAKDYIGLSEADASARASAEGLPNRVIERDGTQLPATMDFVPGRLNFVIRDGEVIRVDVEGETQQSGQ